MSGYRSKAAVLATILCVSLSPTLSRGGLLTQGRCEGMTTLPEVFKRYDSHILENLLFAYGSLWVSDSTGGRIARLGPDGVENGSVESIPPGGLAVGPDGLIYAGSGNSLTDSLLRRGLAKVVRFDQADPAGTMQTYAAGFDMANGLTFAPNGDLFVSNDVGNGPVRIPRDDPRAWTTFGDVWGTNGLVVDPAGQNLYAAVTFDQRSPIERIPLDNPTGHSTAAVLAFGVASLQPAVYTDPAVGEPLVGVKGLDDMTRTDDGMLYVVANGTGELLRVDPVTGRSCLILSGLGNPSSVRIAPSGSAFDSSGQSLTFYITEFRGTVTTVGYTP
jgi:sugar lactone lactonase YvrE